MSIRRPDPPEDETAQKVWTDTEAMFFLKCDFLNSFISIAVQIDFFDETPLTEEGLWKSLEKHHFRSFEEYALTMTPDKATVKLTRPEVIQKIQEVNALANAGNEAIHSRNLAALREVIHKLKALIE